MTAFTQDQWIILALVFVLGMLLGIFLTAGGRKKWKTRYYDERTRLETREREYNDREAHWVGQEKEWRERDSLRAAAAKDRADKADERPV
jgi:hypothetical protein